MYSKQKINNKKHSNRFSKTLFEYGENTSIHGVKYAVAKDNSIFEKILWILVIMTGIGGSVYMTMIFWERYNSNPIRITIQSLHKQTSIIPFPGVTICTIVRQVPQKVDKLLDSLTLPDNITLDEVRNAMPSLLGYTQSVAVNRSDLALLNEVFRKNGYKSIEKLFREIEPSCNEILIKCRWEGQVFPCEQHFRVTYTKDGHCCSFNTNPNSKNFTKFRTLYYGVQMGLSLIIDPLTSNSSDSVTTLNSMGLKILIHSPIDYPGMASTEKILENGTETFIRILGTKLTSSDSIKELTPVQRNCLFETEKKLKYFPIYRDTNCNIECRMNKIYKLCKCMPYIFPNTKKHICNITDISCLTDNYNVIFRSSLNKISDNWLSNENIKLSTTECDCPPQCNDVFYAVQTSSIPMSKIIYTISNFYNLSTGNDITNKMAIHLYFGSHFQTVMLRDTITSTYYLLSSFGGVFSLFLGCSFLSVLELIYYFCIRIFTKYE